MGLGFKNWLLDETLALAGSYKGGVFQRLVAASYKLAPVSDPAALPGLRRTGPQDGPPERLPAGTTTASSRRPATTTPASSSFDARSTPSGRQGSGGPTCTSTPSRPAPRGTPRRQGHPVYSNDQNVMIRGVHDAIAHLGGNHPFSARGEYGAYNRHLKTLCNVQDARAGQVPGGCGPLHGDRRADVSYYYVYGQFAPQKAVFLPDFDHYNVGLLAPSSRLNAFFVVQNKDLVCRPDFDPEVFAREFPALSQELARQVGGPKVRLADIPTRR